MTRPSGQAKKAAAIVLVLIGALVAVVVAVALNKDTVAAWLLKQGVSPETLSMLSMLPPDPIVGAEPPSDVSSRVETMTRPVDVVVTEPVRTAKPLGTVTYTRGDNPQASGFWGCAMPGTDARASSNNRASTESLCTEKSECVGYYGNGSDPDSGSWFIATDTDPAKCPDPKDKQSQQKYPTFFKKAP
jgi:hypothetical protein